MILDSLFNILFNFVYFVINLFPQLPPMPQSIIDGAHTFIDLIFSNLGFLGFFFNLNLLITIVPLVFLILILKYTIKLITWVVSKVPMVMAS